MITSAVPAPKAASHPTSGSLFSLPPPRWRAALSFSYQPVQHPNDDEVVSEPGLTHSGALVSASLMKVRTRFDEAFYSKAAVGALLSLVLGTPLMSQTSPPPATVTSISSMIEERGRLLAKITAMVEDGANPEQIEVCNQNNATLLAAIQQQLTTFSAQQNSAPQSYVTEVQIPSDASETMETFLVERAALQNSRTFVANQTLEASLHRRQKALEAWDRQNSEAMDAQAERAQLVSEDPDTATFPGPPALQIPAGTSPELRDLLVLRHDLMTKQAELGVELQNLPPEERSKALDDWQLENASALQAIQDAAWRLSNPSQELH